MFLAPLFVRHSFNHVGKKSIRGILTVSLLTYVTGCFFHTSFINEFNLVVLIKVTTVPGKTGLYFCGQFVILAITSGSEIKRDV
jgi:hypothetical protein